MESSQNTYRNLSLCRNCSFYNRNIADVAHPTLDSSSISDLFFSRGECCGENLQWFCHVCNEKIWYDFDGKKLCCLSCQKSCKVEFAHFDCEALCDEFMKYDLDRLEEILKEQKNSEPINILLLGETGVGKSTWINGVANYLSFNNIDETIEKGLKVVIQDNFTTIDNEGNVQIVKFEPKGNLYKL